MNSSEILRVNQLPLQKTFIIVSSEHKIEIENNDANFIAAPHSAPALEDEKDLDSSPCLQNIVAGQTA